MKILLIFLIAIIIVMGFSSLNYNNKVFAESLLPCCNRIGQGCQGFPAQENVFCSTPSSVDLLKNDCIGITLTCRDCIDLTVSGCVCGEGNYNCREQDGSLYYGQQVPCGSGSK